MSDDNPETARRQAGRGKETPQATRTEKLIDLATLLDGAQEVVIVHNDEHYRLRITSNGKLILTK